MEVALLIIYVVSYFGSYRVLVSKFPTISKEVSLMEFTWLLSKGANQLYFGWLLAGNFRSYTKGTWLYWALEIIRAYIIIILILALREIYVLLKATV